MKQTIRKLIQAAVENACKKGDLPSSKLPAVEIEEPKVDNHGDFSTNISMLLASVLKMPPRKIAEAVVNHLDDSDRIVSNVEIAGPGFINLFVKPSAWHPVLQRVHDQGSAYGATDIGKGKKVQVEFVSANPTGPLHVGHGRGAAVGDSIAGILDFCGFDVQREYYTNDSGRQIRTLGRSVFFRYRELFGKNRAFPDDCYQGKYIIDLAQNIKEIEGDHLLSLDKESAILFCARLAAGNILTGIREDLASFGINYDNWFSEQSLFDSGEVDAVLADLRKRNIIYKKDGAIWFGTRNFGDEKDRVVIRNNGQTTYFASDIAYHRDKFNRGIQWVIDVWGADHHGYIPRMAAAIEALGFDKDQFDVILVQLVNLSRGGQPVAMSTRSGEFVTLKDVISEVGADAARFIFLTRHYESPLDFDLELAKKKTNDNPVYYVQYVHARISSISRKGAKSGIGDVAWDDGFSGFLTAPEEIRLIKLLDRFPEVVKNSAIFMEPHRITFYLMNLAAAFHAYYNKHRVLTDNQELTRGRIYLVLAVKRVIRNGLALLGVSAPESM